MDFKSPLLHYCVMKVAQKLILTIAVFSLTLSVLAFSDDSEAVETSGMCGDDLTWTFDGSSGTLRISGTGDMYNYQDEDSPFAEDSDIEAVIIMSEPHR